MREDSRHHRFLLLVGLGAVWVIWSLLARLNPPEVREPLPAPPASAPASTHAQRAAPSGSAARIPPAPDPQVDAPVDSPPMGRVRVRVVDTSGTPRPEGWAEPLNCPLFRAERGATDLAPLELAYVAASGPCVLVAARMDGALRVEGEPVAFTVPEQGLISVELPLPAHAVGSLYAAIAPDPHGARLQWIPPGSALDRAGLQRGDILVSVDALPLAGMDPLDILAVLQGPADEPVLIEVLPVSAEASDTGAATVVHEVRYEVYQGFDG